MNILFCSAGRRVELLKDFRKSMDEDDRIIAADLSNLAPALYVADKHYLVSRMDDPNYLDAVLDICRKEKINAVGCPHLNTDVMERFGLVRNGKEQVVSGIHVYPEDYFNPLDSVTGKLTKTKNTYSIHWYSMSWLPKGVRIKSKIGRLVRRFVREIKR